MATQAQESLAQEEGDWVCCEYCQQEVEKDSLERHLTEDRDKVDRPRVQTSDHTSRRLSFEEARYEALTKKLEEVLEQQQILLEEQSENRNYLNRLKEVIKLDDLIDQCSADYKQQLRGITFMICVISLFTLDLIFHAQIQTEQGTAFDKTVELKIKELTQGKLKVLQERLLEVEKLMYMNTPTYTFTISVYRKTKENRSHFRVQLYTRTGEATNFNSPYIQTHTKTHLNQCMFVCCKVTMTMF